MYEANFVCSVGKVRCFLFFFCSFPKRPGRSSFLFFSPPSGEADVCAYYCSHPRPSNRWARYSIRYLCWPCAFQSKTRSCWSFYSGTMPTSYGNSFPSRHVATRIHSLLQLYILYLHAHIYSTVLSFVMCNTYVFTPSPKYFYVHTHTHMFSICSIYQFACAYLPRDITWLYTGEQVALHCSEGR